MNVFLKVLLGVVLLVLALAFIAWQKPVLASKVIWPIVENRMLARAPFKGVTDDGVIDPGLFELRATGVDTTPVVEAAQRFIASLDADQQDRALFAVDDDEWRRWANIHISTRQGVGLLEMNDTQSEAAFGLLAASLSARGFENARAIMRLEGHLADLMEDHDQYGEQRYWFTVMGEPSASEPWGWQIDGHHLIVNFFVLGDQVVMTPTFMGSEPIRAETGPYAGTAIMQEETTQALSFVNALTPEQRRQAILSQDKPGNNNYGELFSDNAEVPAEGLRLSSLTPAQKEAALALLRLHIGNLRSGHAEVKMAEIVRHWSDTWFAWVGGTGDEDVFYYRFFSPVVLVEFDHQLPVALDGPPRPTRDHVHTVVRTPNGNDYGKDLLRQHLQAHPH